MSNLKVDLLTAHNDDLGPVVAYFQGIEDTPIREWYTSLAEEREIVRAQERIAHNRQMEIDLLKLGIATLKEFA